MAGNLESILVITVGTLLLYTITRIIYLAFFHPLSRIPGPRLYALTDFPYLYYQFRGDWYAKLKELHDQYGPVVRFASNNVSFNSPGAWKGIYGHHGGAGGGQEIFRKDPRAYRTTLSGYPNIINANNEDHRRQRRLLSHAFSEKALRAQEGVMKQYIDRLITRLTEKATTTSTEPVVDMVKWYNFTTFDLIGDLAFGEPFGCLERGEYHSWVAMIFLNVKMLVFGQLLQRYWAVGALAMRLMPQRLRKARQDHWDLSAQTMRRRLESGNVSREDFTSYILRHNGDEKSSDQGMSEGEIIENANILIVAGSETTATQLSGTTFMLLSNRDKYDKLVREVRDAFQSEDEITLFGVSNLEYMNAVFEEGFRMYPPVPTAMPRLTPPNGELLEGYWIPGNTSVAVPQWATYQSERNFRNHDKFVPERWLGDPEYKNDFRDALQPFSMGPRNCIGRNLAYAEMRLILARVLWNFDLELMEDSKRWNEQKVYVLWEKGALNVKLTPVER